MFLNTIKFFVYILELIIYGAGVCGKQNKQRKMLKQVL